MISTVDSFYALSPIKFLSVRILLSIDSLSSEKLKRSRSGEQERSLHLSDLGRGSMWFRCSFEEEPSECYVRLDSTKFEKVQNPDLSISDLDEILGFRYLSNNTTWTKERLIEKLNSRGISYEDAARRLGIL